MLATPSLKCSAQALFCKAAAGMPCPCASPVPLRFDPCHGNEAYGVAKRKDRSYAAGCRDEILSSKKALLLPAVFLPEGAQGPFQCRTARG